MRRQHKRDGRTAMTTIGFIGLGNMGGPMCRNLLKAGHRVKAFDLVKASLDRAKKAGAETVGSIGKAVKDVEVVITMLPAGPHVRQVYLGKGGVLENAAKGTLLIRSEERRVGKECVRPCSSRRAREQ